MGARGHRGGKRSLALLFGIVWFLAQESNGRTEEQIKYFACKE